jgi:hypothetical protein
VSSSDIFSATPGGDNRFIEIPSPRTSTFTFLVSDPVRRKLDCSRS